LGIYHIYNQGNNRRVIFQNEENYAFFLQKLQKRFEGVAKVLAYCLMPNHFHLMVKPTASGVEASKSSVPRAERKLFISNLSVAIQGLTSGYAQAYNKMYGRSGSLFRQKTKAKQTGVILPETEQLIDLSHTLSCFHYIHLNPVKANFVNHPSEWQFTSFHEYGDWTNNDNICNVALGLKLLKLNEADFR
jgi:putative transposase